MGFRNPITSLAADQITPGALNSGVTIAAGQITAGTITGSYLRTAGTGPYVAIGKDVQNAAEVYLSTGDASEYMPGLLHPGMQMGASAAPTDQPYVELDPPVMGGPNPNGTDLLAYLRLTGPSRDLNTPGQIDSHVGGPVNLFAGQVMNLGAAAGLHLSGGTPGSPVTVDYPAQLAGETWHTATYGTAAPWATNTYGVPAAYTKDATGRVQCKGLVSGGYWQTTIFNLPPGYRPTQSLYLGCLAQIDGVIRSVLVYVFTSGDVWAGANTGSVIDWLSLDQISFLPW